MTARPSWWSAQHDRALALLTSEWRSLSEIRELAGLFANVFDDLVTAGVAECKREPVMQGRIARGEKLFYRLSVQAPVATEPAILQVAP